MTKFRLAASLCKTCSTFAICQQLGTIKKVKMCRECTMCGMLLSYLSSSDHGVLTHPVGVLNIVWNKTKGTNTWAVCDLSSVCLKPRVRSTLTCDLRHDTNVHIESATETQNAQLRAYLRSPPTGSSVAVMMIEVESAKDRPREIALQVIFCNMDRGNWIVHTADPLRVPMCKGGVLLAIAGKPVDPHDSPEREAIAAIRDAEAVFACETDRKPLGQNIREAEAVLAAIGKARPVLCAGGSAETVLKAMRDAEAVLQAITSAAPVIEVLDAADAILSKACDKQKESRSSAPQSPPRRPQCPTIPSPQPLSIPIASSTPITPITPITPPPQSPSIPVVTRPLKACCVCNVRGKVKRCSRCWSKTSLYCSETCQRQDYPAHRSACTRVPRPTSGKYTSTSSTHIIT